MRYSHSILYTRYILVLSQGIFSVQLSNIIFISRLFIVKLSLFVFVILEKIFLFCYTHKQS
ncbi:hypothetical protein C1645_791273 [Glomus cerebriforme]|uniref:Uncharacterized protein n=1 Tax=Glomus cerebriforme TaxID=658196 RepID=A0A397S6F4_9GLOM|nr:hypothetical protein C1645_791273 [Glomus cerebriforme]